MNVLACCLASLLVLTAFGASAGQINGSLTKGGASVGAGMHFSIQCGNETKSGVTDALGRYTAFMHATGNCTLRLDQHPNASATVYSYEQPSRYDFELVGTGADARLQKR